MRRGARHFCPRCHAHFRTRRPSLHTGRSWNQCISDTVFRFLMIIIKKEKEKKGYYLPSLRVSPFISLLAVRAYEGQGK